MEIKLISSIFVVVANMLNKEQKERYYHTTFLKEIGEQGQEKLLNSNILVVGCGGLGSASLTYLASMGVGHITIIDNDVVSRSNLPRQVLYEYSDINKSKVEVTKTKLERMNPDIKVKSLKLRLDENNALDLLKEYDLVLDCTDNFETKFLINDICLKLNIPFVIAGVRDYQGQVTTCIPNKSKDFKSLFSILPINIDDKYKKADQGIFPFSVALVGNIAGSEVIKYLLNIGELLLDKLLLIDLLNNHYQIVKYPE